MNLAAGARLGAFEVTGRLGSGGMGVVYRARDTDLDRDVAIKVLPESFAADAGRTARFEQEARTLAALNHPNIAHIYGIERSASATALVMELVEGPTLADRIAEGPIPVSEALQIASQIADALEAAHGQHIVHRDLKPANIKLRPDGAVKILDFGIAKALEPMAHAKSGESPVLTTPATHVGVVLGTAAYMSPEQARSKPVDRRTDIWAFGCVLYEMLTGQLAFGGEDVATTLARVIANEANLKLLPGTVPPAVRRTIELCLRKDPRKRLHDIGDVQLALAGELDSVARAYVDGSATPEPSAWRSTVLAGAGLIAGALIAGFVVRAVQPPPAAPLPTHFALQLPNEAVLPVNSAAGPNAVISPDGRYLAFVAEDPDTRQGTLWVRAMDSLSAQRLDRTDGARFPFWSPDSQQIAYFTSDRLMRVAAAGGTPLTITDVLEGEGGTWYRTSDGEGFIIFGNLGGPLQRVPAMGGTATPVTELPNTEEIAHTYPQMLPDGRVLYTAVEVGSLHTYVQSPESNERTLVASQMTRAVYSPPGFLFSVREGALLAQRFDLASLTLKGEAVALAEDVRYTLNNSRSAFSVVPGSLVYRRGPGVARTNTRVRSYSRDGTPGEILLSDGSFGHIEISPDDRYLAVVDTTGPGGTSDIWIKDLSSGTFQRVTSATGSESQEVWAPDSRHLAFSTGRSLMYTEIGSGQYAPVPGTDGTPLLHSWTPDGRYLLAQAGPSVRLIPAPSLDDADADSGSGSGTGSGRVAEMPREVLSESYATDHFRVSPDGNWVAYTSQESGQTEIVIARFPSFTDRRQISLNGGTQPQWRADGRELFFHSNDLRMMSVEITPGESLEVGPVRELFETNSTVNNPIIFMYAASSDGERFYLTEPIDDSTAVNEPLYVLTNWQSRFDGN